MKLITKAIEKKLPELYATDGQEVKDVIVKFFCPWNAWTWYITEGNKVGDDYEFFGYVENGTYDSEWGYVTLSQLEEISGPFGLKIERDRGFEGKINISGELV